MTIQQVLDLPTEDLAKLTDAQLDSLLAPLFPASRQADKEAFAVKHASAVNKLAMAHLALSQGAGTTYTVTPNKNTSTNK